MACPYCVSEICRMRDRAQSRRKAFSIRKMLSSLPVSSAMQSPADCQSQDRCSAEVNSGDCEPNGSYH